MDDGKTLTGYTRRRFLKSGGALLAGGVIGCASINALSPSKPTVAAPPDLPWEWGWIDPMEAGSRAYRFYHDIGG